jgi:hypothetical protein
MDPTSSLSEDFAHLSVGDLNSSHDGIFRDDTSTLPRVSRDRDRFIDEDHKPLDANLMKAFSAFRRHNEEPDLPSLLCNITVGDKRLDPLSPNEAEELLRRQWSIKAILQKAWKDGSFKEVRRLGAFIVRSIICFSS